MQNSGNEIAIVGMACRVPGAADIDAFWANLEAGRASIRFFDDAELLAAGIGRQTLGRPGYVKAAPVLDDFDAFDAAFFGITPKEAALMDPQHRHFLECCWTALEHAGQAPSAIDVPVAVFGSAHYNTHLIECVRSAPDIEEVEGADEVMLGNDPSYMTTRVSYKLNLRGPAMHVETACSSSLTAVHLACQSLLLGECRLALAGGVCVRVPQMSGYQHEPGMITSKDGHCRAFSHDATGTIFGSGVGVVTLKRLADALADGDTVYAVIKATAINNDGAAKLGFTAPSVEGQVRVMRSALALEGIDAASVGYVEAHGTGTKLGDAVEWEALHEVYGSAAAAAGSRCAIGSVKTNIGHLLAAAGIVGLIKATLALHHKKLPATVHFDGLSPQLAQKGAGLYVVDRLGDFARSGGPRRAAVTSLGVGGTNAHVILEEAPVREDAAARRSHHLVKLSASSPEALATLEQRVAARVRTAAPTELADLAFTLGCGRAELALRNFIVVGHGADGERTIAPGVRAAPRALGKPTTVFLFPGNGSQYAGMCRDLYDEVPAFRRELDRCDAILRGRGRAGIVQALYGGTGALSTDSAFIQPAVFSVDYALARVLLGFGLTPGAMLGHSLGEYVCACLAEVLSLEDALEVVAARGALMDETCRGKMLSVLASADRTAALIPADISIAALNAPGATTVSGTEMAIAALKQRLDAAGVQHIELPVLHAFHSALTDRMLAPFEEVLRKVRLSPPRLKYLSNLTGDWILPDQATTPGYWLEHARRPVLFQRGIETIAAVDRSCFVEVGAGTALGGFVKAILGPSTPHAVVSTVRHAAKRQHDVEALLSGLGRCWQAHVELDWQQLAGDGPHHRVAAPTYPFERTRHWYPKPRAVAALGTERSSASAAERGPTRLWVPHWRVLAPRSGREETQGAGTAFVVIGPDDAPRRAIAAAATAAGARTFFVTPGMGYARSAPDRFSADLAVADDLIAILRAVRETVATPVVWAHTLCLGAGAARAEPTSGLSQRMVDSYQSLLHIVGAITATGDRSRHRICVVADELFAVADDDPIDPYKALALGPCRVIPQEVPQITTRCVDVGRGLSHGEGDAAARALVAALLDPSDAPMLAYRDGRAHALTYRALAEQASPSLPLRESAVYLITGGTGVVARHVARFLCQKERLTIVLLARNVDPAQPELRALAAEVEGAGSRLAFVVADVTRADDLYAALARVEAEHGAIRGVVHAAGLVGAGRDFISRLTVSRSMAYFAPKLTGAEHLLRYFGDRELDFGVFMSSSSAVLGGMGDCAYATANVFLDHLALSLRAEPVHKVWRSSTWDQWPASPKPALHGLDGYGEALAASALRVDEARAGLLAVLATSGEPCLSVASDDFAARVEKWTHLSEPSGTQAIEPAANQSTARPSDLRSRIAEVWRETLGGDLPTGTENFFEAGGSSFAGLRLVNKLQTRFGCSLGIVDLFEHPTVERLTALIGARSGSESGPNPPGERPAVSLDPAPVVAGAAEDTFAIVGMAGRFPGADTPAELWAALLAGKDTITHFREDEIVDPLVSHEERRRPGYVRARGVVRDAESFDHLFFHYSLHESRLLDPQQRVFLECCYEAFEDAGIVPAADAGRVGVFASAGISSYFHSYVVPGGVLRSADRQAAFNGNSVDSIATRVSYKLNLTGPSIAVQTFCSSSLVALHEAVASLSAGSCDLALVGGSSLVFPQESGYQHRAGDILSSDGVVRPFDNAADGTVFSNGAAVVLLKRHDAALRDRDNIYCVVRATAVNNDGSSKAGFAAPSVGGQEAVLDAALDKARLDPRAYQFIETHGTGTKIGDPIEITALSRVFRKRTSDTGFCALGSIKGNVGHLDRAAGVTSLIKAALVVRNRKVPPTLHHVQANDAIDFASSPFYVNTRTIDLTEVPGPIIAGVTALGFGGTNAHAIVQESPRRPRPPVAAGARVVVLSGLTARAVVEGAARLASFLETNPTVELADVAFTLQTGRRAYPFRLGIVAADVPTCAAALRRAGESDVERARPEAPRLGALAVFETSADAIGGFLAPLVDGEPLFRDLRAQHDGAGVAPRDGFVRWLRRLGIEVEATERGEGASEVLSFSRERCALGPHAILAAMWQAGAHVDWRLLGANATARRISLPTYAFQRVPCMLALPTGAEVASEGSVADTMKRQLEAMERTFGEQLLALTRQQRGQP